MRPMGRPQLARLVALAIMMGALALFTRDDSASAAGQFTPTGTASLSNTAAGANADITVSFDVFAPSYNFGALISYTPAAFDLAVDADIPNGAVVGNVTSKATLGLVNGPCASIIDVLFTMFDSTVNPAQTVVFEDQFLDVNPADGLDDGITRYPDYLTRIFPGAFPIARMYGATVVAGTDVSLNFMIFEPGTTLNTPAGTVFNDAALGYPSVTVLQAIGDPDTIPVPGSITDFCSTLKSSSTIKAITADNPATTGTNEAGHVYRTNPATNGTFNFTSWALSQRDADLDGIENGLDSCQLVPDPTWNPRNNDLVNDPDYDGIPNSCDPTPNDNTGAQDHDVDGFWNRQDNCPLVQNGFVGTNQHDTDLDGIGDSCDTDPNPNGDRLSLCITTAVTVGSGGTPTPANPHVLLPCGPRQGDVDCQGAVNSADAIRVLRYVGQLSVSQQPGCPVIGQGTALFGDVDCNGDVSAVDALKILRRVAGISVSQGPSCTKIGEVLPP